MSKRRAIDDLFGEYIELQSDAKRAEFLDELGVEDPDLRVQLEKLAAAHDGAGSFLDAGTESLEALPHASECELVGSQIGPYKLLQKLGEGGMGVVYMAERQRPVKQRVALKIIKHGMDSKKFIARFEAERQALAMMDHPNIAKVLDAGCTEIGRPYFVMEMVKGIPISVYCDQNRLTTRERLVLFVSVCQAVHHAHQKGIIHRDLKPSNVLVAQYDDCPVPKVIDFGVAKATNQQLTERTLFTEVGSILGTWEYMSPEQAVLNQLDVDTRSDVYSLGVLLYELLTGETPLDRQLLRSAQLMETLRMIREDEPIKPSTRVSSLRGDAASARAAYRRTKSESLASEIRGDLDWIVMKALSKERSRRYDSANRFAGDIQRFLSNDLVEARPPSIGYQLQKFYQRNRTISLAGTFAFVVMGLALLICGLFVRELQNSNESAEDRLQRIKILQLDRALTFALGGNVERADEASLNFEAYEIGPEWREIVLGQAHLFNGNPNGKDSFRKACEANPKSYAAALAYASAVFDQSLASGQPNLAASIKLTPRTQEDYLFEALYQAWIHPRAAADALEEAIDWQGTTFERYVRYVVYVNKSLAEGNHEDALLSLEAFEEARDAIKERAMVLTSELYVRLALIHSLQGSELEEDRQHWIDEGRDFASELAKFSDTGFAAVTRVWFLSDFGSDPAVTFDAWVKGLDVKDAGSSPTNFAAVSERIGKRDDALKVLAELSYRNVQVAVAEAYLMAMKPELEHRRTVEQICLKLYSETRTPQTCCAIMGPMLLSGNVDAARQLARQALQTPDTPPEIELVLNTVVAEPEQSAGYAEQFKKLDFFEIQFHPTYFRGLLFRAAGKEKDAVSCFQECARRGVFLAEWYWWSRTLLTNQHQNINSLSVGM